MKTEFSTLEVVKALRGKGLHRESLRDWMDRGFIAPSKKAEGQGTKATFTVHDVYMVALFMNLIDYGFKRKPAGAFVNDFGERIKSEKVKGIYPETVYIVFRDEEVRRFGPGTWKLDVESFSMDWGLSNPKFAITGKEVQIPAGNMDTPDEKYVDWKNGHVVNFGALRREVDVVLSRL